MIRPLARIEFSRTSAVCPSRPADLISFSGENYPRELMHNPRTGGRAQPNENQPISARPSGPMSELRLLPHFCCRDATALKLCIAETDYAAKRHRAQAPLSSWRAPAASQVRLCLTQRFCARGSAICRTAVFIALCQPRHRVTRLRSRPRGNQAPSVQSRRSLQS